MDTVSMGRYENCHGNETWPMTKAPDEILKINIFGDEKFGNRKFLKYRPIFKSKKFGDGT